MSKKPSYFSARLFYSYCHSDQRHKKSMDESLAMLKKQNLLKSWSDQNILPGQQISSKVRKEMDAADIMVFLFSQSFFASDECMKEWHYAKELSDTGKLLFRVPVILEDCAWQDLLAHDDIKALPNDGKPVSAFDKASTAWHDVYNGIKSIVDLLMENFSPKKTALEEMEKTDFLSQEHLKLQDTYVFLPLSCYSSSANDGNSSGETITNEEQLLKKKRVLIHGEEMSGKTALGRHLFLSMVEKPAPVLYVDLKEVSGKPRVEIFAENYRRRFNGDYSLWEKQNDKTLILDNLSQSPHLVDFVVFATNHFERVIATLPSDVFNSFFRDEERLADFLEMEIEPLTHRQQERLIKKRLALSSTDSPVTDGRIDQVENNINSIISSKIVPRYPFYVLSILQAYEGFMPKNMPITSYGHCYRVLIIATLIKAGISHRDDDVNACFNFAEHLAFEIYQRDVKKLTMSAAALKNFVSEYKKKFIISDSILNRMKGRSYGIITDDGHFKKAYTRYFFLGSYLSKNSHEHRKVIEEICEASHVDSNYLTLLFIIHHTNDGEIIEDILLRTMCTLDQVCPATLHQEETKIFGEILHALPKNILSSDSVAAERGRERDARDISDRQPEAESNAAQSENEDPINDCYRILKNIEVLGQVLRNKYGSLKKERIEEICNIVAEGGLRLVNLVLKDETEIADYARYLHKKNPTHDLRKIQNALQFLSFLWTMLNIEKIVKAINHPEIRDILDGIVQQRSVPAYDLIGYFSHLDSAKALTNALKDELEKLLKKHNDPFLKQVLSIRTQHYMNTHTNRSSVEQAVCDLLDIKYIPRYVP